jgi:hypothetical protein
MGRVSLRYAEEVVCCLTRDEMNAAEGFDAMATRRRPNYKYGRFTSEVDPACLADATGKKHS